MASNLANNMKATTEAFLHAFNGDWAEDATLTQRAPDCIQTIMPSSVGKIIRGKDEWAAYFKPLAPRIKGAKMTIHDYLASTEERRAVCWSEMTATSPVGPFNNEYTWFFWFDESGEKITKIVEFFDSLAAKELRQKMTEAGLTH